MSPVCPVIPLYIIIKMKVSGAVIVTCWPAFRLPENKIVMKVVFRTGPGLFPRLGSRGGQEFRGVRQRGHPLGQPKIVTKVVFRLGPRGGQEFRGVR